MTQPLIGIPISRESRPAQDIWGILSVVNDIYERHPEKFGNADTQSLLKQDIANYLAQHSDKFPPKFCDFLCETLDKYEIPSPFKDVSLAVVGAWRERGSESTITSASSLLERFGHVEDISIITKKEPLRTSNALTLSGGQKFDYVVTGNVVNAPDAGDPRDFFLACANLLKKDGRVIHMLGFGLNDDCLSCIDEPTLQKFAGQEHLLTVPEGPYLSDSFNPVTQLMKFKQVREVQHSPESVAAYASIRPDDDRDRHYATSNGDASFSGKDFKVYFFEHPEKIRLLKGVLPRDLDLLEDIEKPAKRAKLYLKRAEEHKLGELGSVTLRKGEPLAPGEPEKVIAAYTEWRDDKIRMIAREISPEINIADQDAEGEPSRVWAKTASIALEDSRPRDRFAKDNSTTSRI